MSLYFFLFTIFPFIFNNDFDISKLKVNYFKENLKLYYVNAFNDDKGNLYFEFLGENDNIRYFIGFNSDTEEHILFNNNEIYSFNTFVASNYHESIIVKYDNNINIFSLDCQNMNFINIKNEQFQYREISYIFPNYDTNGEYSHRNSIIKLKNGNYLLSIIIKTTSCTTLIFCHHVKIIIFNFISDNINGFNIISNYDNVISYSNSTE